MKKVLKVAARWLAMCVVFPFAGMSVVWKRLFFSSSVFCTFAELLSLFPGGIGSYLRAAFYRMTLEKFGVDSYILFGSVVSKMETSVGDGCGIGSHTTIGLAKIGDGAAIANYVSILSGGMQHDFSDPARGPLESKGVYRCLHVGRKSFVGDRSVVMEDVGESSIVAAGSIVSKSVPDFTVVAGNPARVVKKR